ncbi:hypothetical protein SAMD00019534_038710, partial [Acytostelium subglobosum LB1]|uniref:hypothetical protein n=1 Tax=Acytostelium subglobosum LB1 TaxID=1410327 RepID=UPI0006450408
LSVIKSEDRGRYIIATRKIVPGTRILTAESPHCFGWLPYLIKQMCSHCFAHSDLRQQMANNNAKLYIGCKTCQQVYYCSQSCYDAGHYSKRGNNQVDPTSPASHYHTVLECLVLKYLVIPSGFSFHHVSEMRMVINYIAQTPYMPYQGTDPEFPLIKDDMSLLVGEHQQVSGKKEDKKTLRKMSSVIKKAFSLAMYDLKETDVMELIAKSTRNCFGIWKNYEECFGLSMYCTASFFNHSCYPNAARLQKGRSIEIVALRDIEPNEEVTICYINVTLRQCDRRTLLSDCYYFVCGCQRCLHTTPAIENAVAAYTCRNPRTRCSGYLLHLENIS